MYNIYTDNVTLWNRKDSIYMFVCVHVILSLVYKQYILASYKMDLFVNLTSVKFTVSRSPN